ncbi:MAG: hypothetical protein ACR2RF_04660 [Geminicoccaceae bacterium]
MIAARQTPSERPNKINGLGGRLQNEEMALSSPRAISQNEKTCHDPVNHDRRLLLFLKHWFHLGQAGDRALLLIRQNGLHVTLTLKVEQV